MKLSTRATRCSPSSRPSPAPPRRAARSRRCPASSSRPRRRVELRATDMEIGLRVPLEGEVAREGAVVLPARLLVDVVRSLPGDGRRSSCAPPSRTSSSSPARRPSTSARCARGLPALPRAGGDGARPRSPAAAFVETVLKVASSASRDETRPVLTGILVSASGDGAADGRDRLLPPERQGDALEQPLEQRFEANVPARALQELDRLVQHGAGEELCRRACARTRSSSRSAASCCPRG